MKEEIAIWKIKNSNIFVKGEDIWNEIENN